MHHMQEGQGTPSLSPTPSPAGSVGSVGSQSSGYSSGELARGVPVSSATHIPVPASIHNALHKMNNDFTLLTNAHERWDKATSLVTEKYRGNYIFVD